MRGKTVMFVGDSLGRNQWESLICMISAEAPSTSTQVIRGDPLSTFQFLVSLKFSMLKNLTCKKFVNFVMYFYNFNEIVNKLIRKQK